MTSKREEENGSTPAGKAAVTLPGTVEKIIPALDPHDPDKAQIGVEGADHLYREVRVDNTLKDEAGQDVELKKGAHVSLTIEADPGATMPKKAPPPKNR